MYNYKWNYVLKIADNIQADKPRQLGMMQAI